MDQPPKLTDAEFDRLTTRFAILFWLGAAAILAFAALLAVAVYKAIYG